MEPNENGLVRVIDPFQPTRKQQEFYRACADPTAEEILFDGSIRAGKTQACCKQLIAWAWRHGGRYLVARKTYPELVDSTMAVMLRGEGGLPASCPEELMMGGSLARAYRAGERTLTLANGAEILFRNLESAEEGRAKLRNISLNAAFIDQVEELTEEAFAEFYEELCGRLSDSRGPQKMILAANPGPSDHWVYRRFIDPDTRHDQTRYIHCTLYDNEENLDEKFFASRIRTQQHNPEYFRRMILGEWGVFSGSRFKCWDETKHVIEPFDIPSHWEIMEGIDYGSASPFAVVWVAIDPLERWYVFAEHFEREWPLSAHARKIKEVRERHIVAPSVSWLDPSCWRSERTEWESIATELADLGIYGAKAQNERLAGWARLEELMTEEVYDPSLGVKTPRLQIFNTCRNLIKELPNLRYKEGTDDVEKRNDHASDALRYVVMSRPPVPSEPQKEEDYDRRTLYAARKLAEAKGAPALYTGG